MQLRLFRYRCAACGKWTESPEICDYGEFLMRSRSGEMRYLNAIETPDFTEMDELIGEDARVWNLDQFQRPAVLHQVFGIACDLDSQGLEFRIGEKVPCRYCGGHEVVDCESIEPIACCELDVPRVTHEVWRRLTDGEKRVRVKLALDVALKNHQIQ